MDRTEYFYSSKSKKLQYVLIALPSGIFLSEIIAMLLVQFHTGPYGVTILLDAVITTALMFPLIYLLSYQPLLNHLADREQAEAIMQVRLRLIQISHTHTVDELLQETLDGLETLTGSTIGFFHFLEADQNTIWLQSWSTNTLQNMCQADGKDSHYKVDQAGVWADCIRQRQPVIHNDYASLPNRKGMPDGHAPIIRELTVPIFRGDQIVAIFGVGNKPTDFTDNDVELVSTLADFAWDIIERKRAEDALRASEEKFRNLVDWTVDWEQWIDPQGDIIYTSPSCERITGYSPHEFIQNPSILSQIIHLDDRQLYAEHIKVVHSEEAGIRNVEFRVIARDGSEHWIDHICRPLFGQDKSYLGRRVSNRDITVRKLSEKEIAERNRNETMLTQTIHNMQLEIARDLHDTVGQNIGYLRMKLNHLYETDLHTKIDMKMEIVAMLKAATESYDLIRGTLDVLRSGGLVNPLTLFIQYANQIEERSSFRIKVSSQGEPRPLSPGQVRQLFFVFREALSNIEKHADASSVSVELIWDDVELVLMIADNGQGFYQEDTINSGHYGLKFMQERIELLNGTFVVESKRGCGTTIKITLPYDKKILQNLPLEITENF